MLTAHLCAVVIIASTTSMILCKAESVPIVMSVPQKSLSIEPTIPTMWRAEYFWTASASIKPERKRSLEQDWAFVWVTTLSHSCSYKHKSLILLAGDTVSQYGTKWLQAPHAVQNCFQQCNHVLRIYKLHFVLTGNRKHRAIKPPLPCSTNSFSSPLHSSLKRLAPVRLPSPPITHRLVMPCCTRLWAAFRRPSWVRNSLQRALPITVPPWWR